MRPLQTGEAVFFDISLSQVALEDDWQGRDFLRKSGLEVRASNQGSEYVLEEEMF
jgi:hypothetical protein